ncbi:AraC family transcriptional regulator [Pelagimonas varians]|nr:AraC family transcriptional regulator [Pelagimonas varians]
MLLLSALISQALWKNVSVCAKLKILFGAGSMFNKPPMITAMALGQMPQFAAAELGEKKAETALQAAGLSPYFLEGRCGYIPEHSLAEFIGGVARRLGYDGLGLLWAPYLTVADYGTWGRYVLSAPDLGTALRRAQKEMQLHSNTDRVHMHVGYNVVTYSYDFGLKGHPSYPDIAYSAIAVILSIHRHFLGSRWSPLRIEFNIPKISIVSRIEETFGCPVSFGNESLRILFPSHTLGQPNPNMTQCGQVSRQDILRERVIGPPESLVQSTQDLILAQLSEHSISLDAAALSLGMSVRTLQRHLNDEGVSFRGLVNDALMHRARELLAVDGNSVGQVAAALGYSSPNNFSRAFSAFFGMSPRRVQKVQL